MPRHHISARHNKATSQLFTKTLQWLMAALLLATLLLNGAADPHARPPFAVGLSLVCLITLLLPIKNRTTRPLIQQTILLGFCLSLWTVLQALPLPLWLPVHPIWRDLSATLDTSYGYISVNPSSTWQALPDLILPITVFAASIMLSHSETMARIFWHKLTLVGFIVVLTSVAIQFFYPDGISFLGQSPGPGQFSGVFVNRNVAASAFGLAGFALLGSLAIRMAEDPQLQNKTPKTKQSAPFWIYVLFAGALFLTAVCVILTRSRAGALVSLVLLLPCLMLIIRQGLRKRFPRWVSNSWLSASFLIGFVSFLVFLIAYGEPVLSRLDTTDDTSRWCTWGSTVEAIRHNASLGTGLGTFQDIFPTYRNAACDGSSNVWHRAHNSYLELYLGMGLPAVLFMVIAYLNLGNALLRGLTRRNSLKGIPITMTGATVFVSIHSLVDFPLQIPGIALYFSSMMGVGASICLRAKHAHHRPGQKAISGRGQRHLRHQ